MRVKFQQSKCCLNSHVDTCDEIPAVSTVGPYLVKNLIIKKIYIFVIVVAPVSYLNAVTPFCFAQNVLNEHLTPYETSSEVPAGLDIKSFAEGFDKNIKV